MPPTNNRAQQEDSSCNNEGQQEKVSGQECDQDGSQHVTSGMNQVAGAPLDSELSKATSVSVCTAAVQQQPNPQDDGRIPPHQNSSLYQNFFQAYVQQMQQQPGAHPITATPQQIPLPTPMQQQQSQAQSATSNQNPSSDAARIATSGVQKRSNSPLEDAILWAFEDGVGDKRMAPLPATYSTGAVNVQQAPPPLHLPTNPTYIAQSQVPSSQAPSSQIGQPVASATQAAAIKPRESSTAKKRANKRTGSSKAPPPSKLPRYDALLGSLDVVARGPTLSDIDPPKMNPLPQPRIMVDQPHKTEKVKVFGGGVRNSLSANLEQAQDSPDVHVMTLLHERGYRTKKLSTTKAGYSSAPTQLQLASFGAEMVKAVNASNVTLLKSLLECGVSPNPRNSFGDSIVDLVCKRSNFCILECLVNHGCSLRVCDGFGRTPLHHAAWASNFCEPIADLILRVDPQQVLVQDKQGRSPMQYVRKELWKDWNALFEKNKDAYYPIDGTMVYRGSDAEKNSDDGNEKLSLDLVRMVASGAISPSEVQVMDEKTRRNYVSEKNTSSLMSN